MYTGLYNEEKVNEYIETRLSGKYLDLLSQIKVITKEIWEADIRIIPYYTDHGLQHSYRVVHYLLRIINSKSLVLVEEEYFILFASAFLHDIGMQCDLSKHTDLKSKLYDKDIIKLSYSNKSSEYSNDEIKELRDHHHEIAYWWIIEASNNRSKYQKFNLAIQDINSASMIQDIADICLYHTKKSIYKADKVFKYNKENTRKQDITALFRLADELDIDARRVEKISMIKNFSYDDTSEFIWWLHSRIQISFNSFGNIVQTISLNTVDEEFSEIILRKLEKDLNGKNKKLTNLMSKNSFLDIVIMEPEYELSDAEKRIPDRFLEKLNEMKNQEPKKRNKPIIRTNMIISSMFHNNELLERKPLDKTMLYEIWVGNSGLPLYYLILGKHGISDKWNLINKGISEVEIKNDININSIIIISLYTSPEHIKKSIKLDIDFTIYHLADFIWEFIVDKKLKEIVIDTETNYYTEQILFEVNNLDDNPFPLAEQAYIYLYDIYIKENYKNKKAEKHKPIFIQAHGGTGKSYLLEKLTAKINDNTKSTKKLAFLISSEIFIQNLKKVNRNEKISSIQKLIKVYADVIYNLTLDETMISQAFFAGNLVILIDGIDEYISIYGDNFLIADFFQSVTDFYEDELSNAKVILTSRLSPKMANIVQNASIKKCIIKGFDNKSLNKYINTRLPKKKRDANKLFEEIVVFFEYKNNEHYSPFFIKTIIDSYENEGKEFELKSANAQAKDDLIYFILDRELNRQSYGIDIDKLYTIFYQITLHMSSQEESYICKDDLFLIVNEDSELLEKILISPLLRLSPGGNSIAFKFPFVRSYFLAKYYISSLNNYAANHLTQLEQDFRVGFSKFEVGTGEAFQQVVEHYRKSGNINIDSSVKNILEYLRKENIDNKRDGELISSLIHLLFQVYDREDITAKDRSNLIRRVFNNAENYNKIYNLCLYGNFPILDFSNMQIIDADFSGYYEFTNSIFNSDTIFQNSLFEIMTEEYTINKNLTNCIFDDMCKRDRILLEICKKNEYEAKDYINKLMNIFYEIVSKFIKNKDITKRRIYSTNIVQGESREIVDYLIKEKFIIKDIHSRQEYSISQNYKKDILSIKQNGKGYSIKMIEILTKINTIHNKVNKKDIENYIHSL